MQALKSVKIITKEANKIAKEAKARIDSLDHTDWEMKILKFLNFKYSPTFK